MRYLMAAVAVVTCPCHLPILVAVLAGTTLGAALSEHWGLAFGVLGVLFVATAWITIRLFGRAQRDDVQERETR